MITFDSLVGLAIPIVISAIAILQTIDQMVDQIMALPERARFQLLAPVVRGKKGTHKKLLTALVTEGFARVRINGEVRELSDNIELDKNKKHDIEVVVDRLVRKDGIQERLTDSLATCLKRAEGIAKIEILDRGQGAAQIPIRIMIKTPAKIQSKIKIARIMSMAIASTSQN
jgi:excinuclease UvrABC ATPase subunit